jgi:hypothetical protein
LILENVEILALCKDLAEAKAQAKSQRKLKPDKKVKIVKVSITYHELASGYAVIAQGGQQHVDVIEEITDE